MTATKAKPKRAKPSPTKPTRAPSPAKNVPSALAQALADSYTLSLKTQGVHWNVTGPMFLSLHQLTEAQYLDLAQASDQLAERLRAIDEPAPASYTQFARLSALDPEAIGSDGEAMARQLAEDNRAVAERLAQFIALAGAAGDSVSEDMLIGRKTVHDKAAWMLAALTR